MTLFELPAAAPWRPPAGLLNDRGVAIADSVLFPAPPAVYRAVAEHIALGGWCDALAWADLVPPLDTVRALRGRRSAPAVDADIVAEPVLGGIIL